MRRNITRDAENFVITAYCYP